MIGIISDIHGNYSALCSVLEQIDELEIDRVICLGDVAGYYSQINECCELLQERNILTLMGNHDWYIATGERCPRSTSANECLDYQRKQITNNNLNWLKSLPNKHNVDGLNIVHGGWVDPIDEYVGVSIEYFSKIPGQFFSSGHTHVQLILSGHGKLYCNPGSVGQPRDGDPRAAFAIWDGLKFELHRANYDIQRTQDAMSSAGFSSYFSENLSNGTRIGGGLSKPVAP